MEELFPPSRNICRLCGEESEDGSSIFEETSFHTNIYTLINKYLPIRVNTDDELPKFVCQACTLQLYSTIFFLDLVINGQVKLRDIFKEPKSTVTAPLDNVLPLSSSSILPSHSNSATLKLEPVSHHEHFANVSDPLISSSVTSQNEARLEQYKSMASLNMSPSQMIHDDVPGSTHAGSIFSELGDDIKKIFSMPLDENRLYSDNHDLCTKAIELNTLVPKDPPKKKRGRPRKDAQAAESNQSNQEKMQESIQHIEPVVKRKRKVPSRYLEGVQGTELEKILNDTDTEADKAKFLGPNAATTTTTTITVLNTADTLMLEGDLEPFHIAASDHILDGTTPLDVEIPLSTQIQTVPISNDLVVSSSQVPVQPPSAITIPTIPGQVVKPKIKSKEVGPKVRRKKRRKLYLFCEVCNKSFPHNLQLKMHRHTHNLLYKCSQCSLHYHIYSNLEAHQTSSLHANYEIVDQNVQDPLVTEDSHVIDSYINEENGQITCRHCNKQFLTKTSLTIHIKLVLNKSRAYSCPMCQEFFQMYSSLRQHIMNKHKSKTRAACVCDICSKEFAHPSSVLYHKATAHNTTAYKCPKCPKEFRHTQLLNRHQLVHMETRPFKCPTCTMSFKTNISLNAHLMKHTGAKAHVCEICNKVLTHRSSLISHYRWHQGIKLHQCSQCPKAFNQKGNLKEHFRIHTGEKPFSCEICGRKFTTYSQHKLHMKRHTGEKPHTCELCLKGFLSAESYKCHLRRHRGEKPYPCTFENCQQTFVESWALKKHQRVHMDQAAMLSCDFCDKLYSCTTTLKKHLKTHEDPHNNKVSLLNIDYSLLDIINKSADQSDPIKQADSPQTEILSRSEAITSFSEPDGNVFYLYEDPSGLIATTGEAPDKSPDMEEQPDEETTAALLQNQSFELVTDGSKFHIVRFPMDLGNDTEQDEQEPGECTGDSIITISNDQSEMIEQASMPPLILTQDMIDEVKLDTHEVQEEMDGQEGEQNYIEFITEDGNHVRMMGVSYNSLQLLTMEEDIEMFETKS
uniref:Zinc finger protein 62 homolog n=1 Tax=Cacopsylla melanoneura TaxID=428564 RepID=A0A8D8PMX5_9HEMI